MAKVVLLLGGNLGNQLQIFNQAIQFMEDELGRIERSSSAYKTPAWGFKSGNDFLNQVIILSTDRKPENLLNRLKNIELELGRDPQKKSEEGIYQDRLIDIDILFYNDLVYSSPTLILPHPRLHLRKFTLVPLNDLLPEFVHPLFNKPIKTLLKECIDSTTPIRLWGK